MALRIFVGLLLATILALFQYFKEKLPSWGIPKKFSSVVVFILVLLVFLGFPFIEKIEEEKRERRIESKIDEVKEILRGELREPRFTSPGTESKLIPELVSSQGSKILLSGLKDEGTVTLWYTTKRVENTVVNGKSYLFDLFSKFPNKDRISMYFQTINHENNLVVQVFDKKRNSYLIRHNIEEWKDNTRYFIALTFSSKTSEVTLYVNGIPVQKLGIENLKFDLLGPELYLGRDYSGRNE